MAFLQSCLLRLKTQEIVNKLINLGYEFPAKFHHLQNLVTIPYKGHGWGTLIALKDENVEEFLELNRHNTIDCGTNEKLFFALSALNDRTDIMQWFVSERGNWFLCVVKKFDINLANWLCCDRKNEWHKATVEELIEHFSR